MEIQIEHKEINEAIASLAKIKEAMLEIGKINPLDINQSAKQTTIIHQEAYTAFAPLIALFDAHLQARQADLQKAEFTAKSEEFGALAHKDRSQALGWLVGTAALVVLLFGLIGWELRNIPAESALDTLADYATDQPLFFVYQYVAPRVLLASALFYALAVSVRAYRAALHNAAINAHKSASLLAIVQLLNISREEERQTLLSNVSTLIFSHQPPAYLRGQDTENPLSVVRDVLTSTVAKTQKSEP